MAWVQNGFVWTLPGSIVATVVGSAGTEAAYSCVGGGPVEMHPSVDAAKEHCERMVALLSGKADEGLSDEPVFLADDADDADTPTCDVYLTESVEPAESAPPIADSLED